jgi:hypothetical protein
VSQASVSYPMAVASVDAHVGTGFTRTAWLAFRREEVRARRRFATAWVFPLVPPILTSSHG